MSILVFLNHDTAYTPCLVALHIVGALGIVLGSRSSPVESHIAVGLGIGLKGSGLGILGRSNRSYHGLLVVSLVLVVGIDNLALHLELFGVEQWNGDIDVEGLQSISSQSTAVKCVDQFTIDIALQLVCACSLETVVEYRNRSLDVRTSLGRLGQHEALDSEVIVEGIAHGDVIYEERRGHSLVGSFDTYLQVVIGLVGREVHSSGSPLLDFSLGQSGYVGLRLWL